MACGENHQSRKSGELVASCRSGFMSIKNAYPQPVNLWKTLVDKPVENVENYALSTVISPLWSPLTGCGKLCIPVCIKLVTKGFQPCYVTGCRKHLPFENFRKSSELRKNCCQNPPGLFCRKNFLWKTAKKFLVSSDSEWRYSSYPFISGGTPCREK